MSKTETTAAAADDPVDGASDDAVADAVDTSGDAVDAPEASLTPEAREARDLGAAGSQLSTAPARSPPSAAPASDRSAGRAGSGVSSRRCASR